jgi:hypothetical protein
MSCNLKKLVNVIFHTTLAARDRQNTKGKQPAESPAPGRDFRAHPRGQSAQMGTIRRYLTGSPSSLVFS